MTTRERIQVLANNGEDQHVIAAVLGLTVAEVEPGYKVLT